MNFELTEVLKPLEGGGGVGSPLNKSPQKWNLMELDLGT